MTEFHIYSDKNITCCQKCKDIYNEFQGEEDREIENYHKIVTFSQKIKNNKKRIYTATMSDFRRGAKLQLNLEYKGNSQLGAFDVVSEDEEDEKNSIEK
jgi:hypothetical protein